MSEIKELNMADVSDLFPKNETVDTTDEDTVGTTDDGKDDGGDDKEEKINPQPLLNDATVGDLFPDKKEDDDDLTDNKPKNDGDINRYAELSKILYEEGIFDNLDEDDLDGVEDADGFKALITEQINRGLNERQQEINEALIYGVDRNVIQTYATAMSTLSQIELLLEEESENGKKQRANVIYQDYINKGIKDAKARALVQASLTAGTDIEDAKEAFDNIKAYYTDGYKQAVAEAKEEELNRQEYIKEQDALLRKNLLEKKDLFGGIDIDKNTRRKAYDAITKASARDENGNQYTAVQKYAQENPVDFRAMLGLVYSMTDGFTNLNKLFNKAVNKKVNSKLDDLTKRLTSSDSQKGEGGLRYRGGTNDNSINARGWRVVM